MSTELIKENEQRLYDFCHYMFHGGIGTDDLVLAVFRDIGRDAGGTHDEARLVLFKTAWERIQNALTGMQFQMPVGRDTRQFKGLDEDLIRQWQTGGKDIARIEPAVLERLSRIDADFRAAVVLRDILGFSDDDAVRILGTRWGVYRHRLHRGRLEMKDGLRARAVTSEARGIELGNHHPSPAV